MVKDEWMLAAMSDDTLVVELLVRLKQSQATAASPPLKSHPPMPQLPLTWSVRMPRSRAIRCDPAAFAQRNKRHSCVGGRGGGGDSSTRCSPTTPLSWSAGGASPSGTADGGFEEDSGVSPSLPRSKGTAKTHELASTNATTSRRSRRKKTFAELKEEENMLLKEKVHLKKELTKLRATIKEQTAENESLKRMKLELGLHSAVYANADGSKGSISSLQYQKTASSTHHHGNQRAESCGESNATANGGFFMLPDLNLVPCEDVYRHETPVGLS